MSPGEVRQLVAEPLTGVVAEHGEGPLWDQRSGRLVSMDMLAGALLVTDPATGDTVRREVPSPVAAMARPTRDGDGWLVVGEREIFSADADLSAFEQIGALPVPEGVRANDGGCDPSGRLYVGTMAYDQSPGAGDLFVRQLDGAVEVALPGVTISNGLVLRPGALDGLLRRHRHRDAGAAVARLPWSCPFAADRGRDPERARRAGRPDRRRRRRHLGGSVGRGAVHRYTADGELDVRVELPVQRVTSCAFGGAGLRELYITTSRYELEGDSGPAGAVFRCDAWTRWASSRCRPADRAGSGARRPVGPGRAGDGREPWGRPGHRARLGEAGATVYVTGRTVEEGTSSARLPGTVHATAEEVTRLGGTGSPSRATPGTTTAGRGRAPVAGAVRAAGRARQQRLGRLRAVHRRLAVQPGPFWEQPLGLWDAMHRIGVRAHYVTSALARRC
jgi:sugar lactone lactonase YvrE